ncbi:hypothetical protein ACWGQ5_54650, partial [Streptomyces sp. NPDC055722]
LTLDEDQDHQKIARWVTVHPPISGQFSPVAETELVGQGARRVRRRPHHRHRHSGRRPCLCCGTTAACAP